MWKPSKSRNWKKAAVKQKSEDNCHDSQIGSGVTFVERLGVGFHKFLTA
jgi:hypothetical protein